MNRYAAAGITAEAAQGKRILVVAPNAIELREGLLDNTEGAAVHADRYIRFVSKRSPEFWFLTVTGLVGAVIATLIVGALKESDATAVMWGLSTVCGVGAGAGALRLIHKFITPRVEKSDAAWDGFLLLVGGTVGVTVVAMLGAAVGIWLANGVSSGS